MAGERRTEINSEKAVLTYIPACLCWEGLHKLSTEIVELRVKYPSKRVFLVKANSTEAFRNVRLAQEHAQTSG